MVYFANHNNNNHGKKWRSDTHSFSLTQSHSFVNVRRRYINMYVFLSLFGLLVLCHSIQFDDDVFQCYCLMHNNDVSLLLFVACKQKHIKHTHTHTHAFFSCECSMVLCYAILKHTIPLDAETVWLMLYIHTLIMCDCVCAWMCVFECACVSMCMSAFCFVLFSSVSKRDTVFQAENEVASVILYNIVWTQCDSLLIQQRFRLAEFALKSEPVNKYIEAIWSHSI